jgi:hypothetical protein
MIFHEPFRDVSSIRALSAHSAAEFNISPGRWQHVWLVDIFFLEVFCDISHRLGGITPFGVFSDSIPGLKMWVTFACATVNLLTQFIISIAVLENMPPDAGLQKRATFPH